MKLTKTQLRQIIQEAFSENMTDSQLIAQNRLDINNLYGETRRVRAEFQDSFAELLDHLSTREISKEMTPEVIPGKATISIDANAGGMPVSSEEDELDPGFMPEGKLKLTKSRLKQIIKEELKKLSEGGLGLHPRRWNVFANGEWQEVTLTDEEKQAVDELYDLGENTEELVVQVLEQSRGIEIEDVEPTYTNREAT